MPTNSAAWIPARGAQLQVGAAPYTSPGDDEIVVRNVAVAVNPLDWVIQVAGSMAYRWLEYPFVLGADVAGEVVETGAGVTRFHVGDRVLGHAVGTDKDSNSAARGGFQHYTVVSERLAAPIPDAMAFEDAAVLPLSVSTAACALFQGDQLALRHPSLDPRPVGGTVLVWGGSTSVGSNAIQLAAAAGYDVVATASPRNFDHVRSLGAAQVFDYASPTVVADIVASLAGRTCAGAVAIGTTGAAACVAILGQCEGNRFVSIVSPPVSFAGLAGDPGALARARLVRRLVTSNVALQARARTRHVRTKYVWGTSLKKNEVSAVIYRDYLPAALAAGSYVAAPAPTVVGKGLQELQRAMDLQREGVSAAKVVVTLA